MLLVFRSRLSHSALALSPPEEWQSHRGLIPLLFSHVSRFELSWKHGLEVLKIIIYPMVKTFSLQNPRSFFTLLLLSFCSLWGSRQFCLLSAWEDSLFSVSWGASPSGEMNWPRVLRCQQWNVHRLPSFCVCRVFYDCIQIQICSGTRGMYRSSCVLGFWTNCCISGHFTTCLSSLPW